jgi:hypothetical protein
VPAYFSKKTHKMEGINVNIYCYDWKKSSWMDKNIV